MRKIALALFCLLSFPFFAYAANNVYIAQNAAGSANGADCADAFGIAYFNTFGNWTLTPTGVQIGPDTTVHLCGTWTGAAGASGMLTAQGSGTSGHPIRIQFEIGANATAPYWGAGGFITINGKGFIQIDGSPTSTPCGYVASVDVSCNGLIQATANGALLANHVSNSHGISLGAGTHDIEARNFDCENLFVAVQNNTNNEKTSGINNSACVWWYPSASGGGGNINTHNIKFNQTFNGVLYAYQGSNAGMHADNMWGTNIDTCAQIGAGTTNASITSGSFNNNDCSNMAAWDAPGDANHHEFIHLYTQQAGATISNFTIAGNYLHGTLGGFMTAEIYVECDGGTTCTAPGGLQVAEYNNVIVNEDPNADISLGTGGNGMNECEGSTCQIYNNTYFSLAHYSSDNFAQHLEAGSVVTAKNNIFSGMNQSFANGGGTLNASGNLGFGLNIACGTACSVSGNPQLNLSSSPKYQLQSGSAAAAAGSNLTSLGITGLDSDQLGNARPSGTAAWDMGAFNLVGGGTPAILFTPGNLTFTGQVQGTPSPSQSIVAKNTGTATLTISSITITGTNASDFVQTNNCNTAIAPAGSCTINVVFTPGGVGSRSASISVANNVAGSPQTIALSGTGIAAVAGISFTPTTLAFGNQQVAQASSPLTTTVTNTGTGTLTVTGVVIGGTNASDFTQTNNCNSVAPSGTCTINVTFKPGAVGSRSGTISVTDNAAGSPQSVPLTGTGTAATVSLNPATLTFTTQTVGTPSASQSTTLTNTGTATLTISSIVIGGTNAGDFTQTNNCGSFVLASGSCIINAVFKPTASGSRSASVVITDNAAGSPHMVSLQGTGQTTAPVVTLSPAGGVGLGNVVVNNSALVVQHIKNTGNATLTFSGLTVGGANASMFNTRTTCGLSLAPNFSCEIAIIFKPTSVGVKSATVSIADNAANSPQVVNVTGTGVNGPSPTLDQYGGVIASPCASMTGRFHVEQVGLQWTYCTPLGNEFYLIGVYIVDYGGNAGYTSKIIAKYGSTTAWAVPTLQRIRGWGFNSPYYTSNAIVRPFATDPSYPIDANGIRSIPIKLPFELKLSPGLYGMRNPVFNTTSQFPTGQMLPIGQTVKNMAAGWSPIYYNPGNFVPPTGEADYYDPNLTTFANNFLSSQESGPITSPYSDYVIGMAYDDGDQVFGFGAGPDFTTTPPGHNNPNLGWLAATMAPTQVASSLYPAVYSNTQVYTKNAWMTYLQGKYGTIGALNTAWGSSYTTFGSSGTNFTGESIGTGDGTTTTFTHTLAHLTPTRFTVQVVVNGVVFGGDLGHGTTGTLVGYSPTVTPAQTMSGTLVYSTGALSVTFNAAPPAGATITANYQQNGWQFGTGLMDEDGRVSHQGWLSGDPFALSGANTNTATDLNAFFAQMASTYLGVGHTALAANLPGYLFLGPDSLGSWQSPPARQVLQAIPGNVDVYVGPMMQSTTPSYQAKLDFIETWAGNIPQQNGSYLHANPDSPYSSNPVAGDFTTQFLKGQGYGNLFVSTKAATYTANSVHPFIALNHFDFLDISSENTNWGLVTLLDNAYNGVESVTGTVTCSAPLQAFSCGGEAGNYGDYTDCVTQANITGTVCSGAGTPLVSVVPSSLTFTSQAVGAPSNAQVIVVTNTGTAPVVFSSISLTGANPGDFGQTNTCGTTLVPNTPCSISVTFMPTAAGTRTANVSIADNVSGSPQIVTLTGTGVVGPIKAPDIGMFGYNFEEPHVGNFYNY